MTVDKNDFVLCGWIIEQSNSDDFWEQHLNRKIYSNEKIVTKALEEIIKSSYWISTNLRSKIQYRITPVYTLSPKVNRWVTINKIID